MARMKRSELPPVMLTDLHQQLERVRPTPNGGWAWRCHYCNHYASSESLSGRYLCRRHGGVTPKQRDWLQHHAWYAKTGKRLRQPGRPLLHGLRSRVKSVRVAALLAEAAARQRDLKRTFRAERDRW